MITSRNNPTIKAIRSLRQRRERNESGLFWLEGIRIVTEAVQLDAAIEYLVVAPELLTSAFASSLVTQARNTGRPVIEVSGEVFTSLSTKDGPQGLGAVVRQRWYHLNDLASGDLWVALSAISDPGNLGTILRTSDAVGASGVVLLDATTDPYDPATIRASMGAIFSQKIIRATWQALEDWEQRQHWTIVGAADSAPLDYQALHYSRPLILLMGSEREGLTPQQQQTCNALVSIPMLGRSDSLNLAVATSVILYEILNQKRKL